MLRRKPIIIDIASNRRFNQEYCFYPTNVFWGQDRFKVWVIILPWWSFQSMIFHYEFLQEVNFGVFHSRTRILTTSTKSKKQSNSLVTLKSTAFTLLKASPTPSTDCLHKFVSHTQANTIFKEQPPVFGYFWSKLWSILL